MVSKDQVVSMNYTLTDTQGQVLDQSSEGPLDYLHGHGNIIPGLEKALEGMQVGQRKQVLVLAAQAYGELNPDLRFSVDRAAFGDSLPQPGMMVQLHGGDQHMVARVTEVGDQEVSLDANHHLAGQDLNFDVEIAGVRPATAEELAHGHVHGAHAHHH